MFLRIFAADLEIDELYTKNNLMVTRVLFFVTFLFAPFLISENTASTEIVAPMNGGDGDGDTFEPNVIQTRLLELQSVIPLNLDDDVMILIKRSLRNGKKDAERMITECFKYFPIFDYHFEQAGVPNELKYIALLESAMHRKRKSKVGAAGFWQLMPRTARELGLVVNSKVDERMDPYKSTEAAAKYLSFLYRQFGDWELVLLSYNCGMGKLRSAIKKANSRNVQDLLPYLPKQTTKYLPFYTAMTYTVNFYSYHGLYPHNPTAAIREIVSRSNKEV